MKKIKTTLKNRLVLVQESTEFYGIKIISSNDVYKYIKEIYDVQTIGLHEEFYIIMLDRANNIIGHSLISSGGYSATVADGKMIFSIALKETNASALILVHNHPSGQLRPSDADVYLTKKMVEFGKMIDLPILDHLIITESSYYSFADNGKI